MGGGMLRAVGRAVGTGLGGVQESISTARPKPTTLLSVTSSSSPSSSSVSLPVSATSTVNGLRSSPASIDADEWEAVEQVDAVTGFSERFVFGPVPSRDEVEDAVSALQQVFAPAAHHPQTVKDRFPSTQDSEGLMVNSTDLIPRISSVELQSNCIEPVTNIYDTKALQSQGFNNVFNACRLLQTNTSIQRMVISLSSDKAVWDAVMNNEAMQELRESFYAAEEDHWPSSEKGPQGPADFLRWIVDNAKAKVMELMEKIMTLVNDLFRSQEKEKAMDIFDEAVRSSFMLSIMVLLVVVVTRVQKA
ncbi:uncharacterized protein LOC131233279 isoform X2 [Magnolia sinica]|uniref:uncharacterized protein LOC131233279 isoform X2 n=1 Tax=Magnolia sinica TaxID=86752 RepID=UPI002658B9E6|nr:uncharacterized protein LOC131233279 isoform X2 [Magnolia sinica]